MRHVQALIILAFSLTAARAVDDYTLGPDSLPQAGVPRGKVEKHTWTSGPTNLFPGTVRDYWIYVPAQYDAAKPACLMVFQDGGGYISTNGSYRVPTVFDNLIHKKQMPVTIGVFLNPGVVPPPSTNALPRFNRSLEYDGLGDRYARFLIEEFLPEVTKGYNIASDANSHAIAGASSGAIAAFTAAWERPEAFSRVFSSVGTFVGLRGGNEYPTLIRKTEPKALRVFLQDGSGDQNIYGGNWWIANQDMLSALEFAGYEVNHAWGDGGHNGKHAGAVLPDALRWLWKDYPKAVGKGGGSPQLKNILIPGEDWKLVSQGHKFTEGPVANTNGEVFFTDIPNNRIHKIGLDGKVTVFAENTGGANGLSVGVDGNLFACANDKKEITYYDADGKENTLLRDSPSNDGLCLPNGGYFTDPDNKKVWHVDAEGERRTLVDTGIKFPNGIVASPDQSLLYVADSQGKFVYSFQIQPDGTLADKQAYYHLHTPDGMDSGADGLKVDTDGNLYVATRLGVQICDQAGRVNCILPKPQRAWLSNLCFGGAKMDELYITCGDKVYKRKVKTKGVFPFLAPIKPAAPRL
ncbi:MAG TPA: SMP-30/gluconolactonase/LRE family protein [Verrucomicrobiae bacterium]|nr:SMP-30/gluconolactonase/LRE family protein [Verrucomicrobiae bacterium]